MDKEIEDPTNAALERPNDYSMWWAAGGVIVGVLGTLLIASAVNETKPKAPKRKKNELHYSFCVRIQHSCSAFGSFCLPCYSLFLAMARVL